jgi:class 3 adenylate cyclase
MSDPVDERKVATLLFADLVGSTELAGPQDPERTRALLERFYEAMTAEIEEAGGTVEKFAGDAVMAVFGAPSAYEDHAERALHAALSMRRRLDELFEGGLQLRIGVNTGEVVVGQPREGSSFVSGDAVNVAARLEQGAAPGEILVGERTAAAVRGAFEFDTARVLEAKGKPGGIPSRRLLRALSLMRPRGLAGFRPAFVGRDTELGQLSAAYADVSARGEPHAVTIVGDAGVGKTRLVRELWERLGSESPEPLRRTGHCLPYGQGVTYWPLAEVLKEHLSILETDSEDEVRARLGSREILGLTLGLEPSEDLHPLVARDRLQEAWVEFFDALTAERPTVVLVEDVHWAEDSLLDLLERLLRDVKGPLLFVVTARPELLERRGTWAAGRVSSSLIWLEPLPAHEAAQLVDELLASAVHTELRELVVERAEGNPFFVEELLATLIDQRVLERADGHWIVRDFPRGFAIPDSVQAVVAARIDLLDPPQKAALQAAAVIGRVFWTGPVYELAAGEDPDFRLLEDRDFIRRRSASSLEGEREYAFKHALTRAIAYESLPKSRRARLHAAFGKWLERVGGGRDEHAPLLAHHYAEAVRAEDVDLVWTGEEVELRLLRDKAIDWLRRAAALAIGRYEIDEALALLHQGLTLEASEVLQAELWREIGRANALKYDGEAFWQAMQKSLETCEEVSRRADTYSELALHTATRRAMWTRHPDPGLIQEWIDHALELAEPGTLALARALIARGYVNPTIGADDGRVAAALAERLGDPELRSWAFDVQARAAFALGEYEDACAWYQRRIELIPEIGDPDHVALIYFDAVDPSLALGRFDEGRRIAMLHDELTRPLTPHHRVHAFGVLIFVEHLAGQWRAVRELTPGAEKAVEANRATPCALNEWSLLACAVASARLGEEQEADRLEASAEALGMEGYGSVFEPTRVQLALVRGRLDEVERKLANWSPLDFRDLEGLTAHLDALAALGLRERVELEASKLLKPNTYVEPFALRALGVVREEGDLIEQAVDRFEEMGLRWHAEQTRAQLVSLSTNPS